jgi:hypothetical protein
MPDPKAGVIRSEHPRAVGVNGLVEAHNWVLRDGSVKIRDGISPVTAPGLTLITPGSSWGTPGGNVWRTELSGEPWIVFMNGVKGNPVDNEGSLAAEYDWVWDGGWLFVYSTNDPDTEYIDPGVQWASGTGNSSVTALISHDYQGTDDSDVQGVVRDQLTETDVDWAWAGAVGQNPDDPTDAWAISQKISIDWSGINWAALETAHSGTVYGVAVLAVFTYLNPAGITLYVHTFDDTTTKNISAAVWEKPGTDTDVIYHGEYESGYPWQILTSAGGTATGIYVIFSDTWDSWYDELTASGGDTDDAITFVWSCYQAEDHGLPGGQSVIDMDRTTRPVARTWDYEGTTHTLIAAKDKYILDVDSDSLGAVPDPTVSVAGDAGVSPRARCIGIASQRVIAGNVSYFDTEATMDENEVTYNLDYVGSRLQCTRQTQSTH